ncbi:bifunctional DNA primase/polymerase [Actinomadura barringtoniae]|uniref:Bifunctional DNA primase/polymerase n=1 Tax=Actinomadura barringtoniae TaxID=1427535 RepID=A0A939PD78_9ACTN|nr:bifunctional DNA primase/polymerase [Actinomadura barringtoniae]MBO2447109.1 bifunctional DNA primase/polymerase [Actinomadura barringtoniae]
MDGNALEIEDAFWQPAQRRPGSHLTNARVELATPVGRAAAEYVSRWGWPVMVGARLPARGDRCGLGACSDVLELTTDLERVREWWTRWPHAGIVTPAGEAFDMVTLPVKAGHRVLERLTSGGAWLGAVMSDDDTVTLLVATGQAQQWTSVANLLGTGFAHIGTGQLVVLPPGSPQGDSTVRWVVPPTDANVPHLPEFEDLSELIMTVALRKRDRWRRSCR